MQEESSQRKRDKTQWDPHPIKGILVMRKITQAELSALTGYHQEYITIANNGRVKPNVKYRAKCAEVLGLSEAELFDMSRVE